VEGQVVFELQIWAMEHTQAAWEVVVGAKYWDLVEEVGFAL
jgi:hypothetical protein